MPGASPLVDNMDNVRRLEDAGAAAIVMHSLFAEQIEGNQAAVDRHIDRWEDTFAEATSFFPQTDEYVLGPQEYLSQIQRIKKAVQIPVIASLNGTHPGSWIDHAIEIQKAGADALELNTYFMVSSRNVSAAAAEQRVISIVSAVRKAVTIPVAVKLSPFYTSVAHLAGRLEAEEIDGLVLFNRFFQPDINLEELEVHPKLDLSNSEDLRLRLRWLGLLRDQVKFSLACTGGVHGADDVAKALLAGADAVQMTAELLTRGSGRVAEILKGLQDFMESHEYESVSQMVGALSLRNCPDAEAYERGNYLRALQLWKE